MEVKIKKMFDMFFDLINNDKTLNLINLIHKSKKEIILCGVGKNWYICQKIEKTLISLGIPAYSLDPVHAMHGDIGKINNQIIIFISKSGNTTELEILIEYLFKLKTKNIINPILVGLFLNNTINNKNLDFLILPSTSEIYEFDKNNLIPTLSINILQMVLDYISIKVFELNSDLMNNYKYNHPNGSIGNKLKNSRLI